MIHNFRKSLGDWDKTDDLDTAVITERLRFGRQLPYPFHMEERYLPLRTLTRYRYHLVGELVRVKSHALSLVYLKASEYTARPAFANIFGKTSQAVLKEFPSWKTVATMPFDELVEWLDVKGKRRFRSTRRTMPVVCSKLPRIPINCPMTGWPLSTPPCP